MNKTLRHINLYFRMRMSYFNETSFDLFTIFLRFNNYSDIFSSKLHSLSNSIASEFSVLKTMIFSLNCYRNFLSPIELKNFICIISNIFLGQQITFLLYYSLFSWREFSFSAVFQIQWLGRISLFWKSRVHFTTQWSTQRKVQFMGFQRVSKDVLLLVNVVD